MSRNQRHIPHPIELHRSSDGKQRIECSDPEIAHWLKECGIATTPVAIKLTGEKESDVALQIDRLKRAFGDLVHFSLPRKVSNGVEWIAHGTIMA